MVKLLVYDSDFEHGHKTREAILCEKLTGKIFNAYIKKCFFCEGTEWIEVISINENGEESFYCEFEFSWHNGKLYKSCSFGNHIYNLREGEHYEF